jgi:hypothetical protein
MKQVLDRLTDKQKKDLATVGVLLLFLILCTADSWFNF